MQFHINFLYYPAVLKKKYLRLPILDINGDDPVKEAFVKAGQISHVEVYDSANFGRFYAVKTKQGDLFNTQYDMMPFLKDRTLG